MRNKLIFLLFISITFSKIVVDFPKSFLTEALIELPQYGEIEATVTTAMYMKLDGFTKGDNIYLEVSFDIGRKSSNYTLPIVYEWKMNLKVDDIAGLLKATSFSQSGNFILFIIH